MATEITTIRDQVVPATLIDAEELRTTFFGANPPSPRWIRDQTKRGVLSSFKIGRLRWYDPERVRADLECQCLIRAKGSAAMASRKGGGK